MEERINLEIAIPESLYKLLTILARQQAYYRDDESGVNDLVVGLLEGDVLQRTRQLPEAIRIAKDFFGRCFDETEESEVEND